MLISRRAALLAPGLLAAPALAQADNRPVLTIAVQRLSNSNTFEPPREQSNVGFRIHGRYSEQLIGTDWLSNAALVPGLPDSAADGAALAWAAGGPAAACLAHLSPPC